MSSSDTLVIKIESYSTPDDHYDIAYVFYDYQTETYGLRFGELHETADQEDDNTIITTHSYYATNKESVCDLVAEFIPFRYVEALSLQTFKHLPRRADNISFERLYEANSMANPVSTYDTPSKSKRKLETFVDSKLRLYCDLLENVYNEY
jgi:hypothetical protein